MCITQHSQFPRFQLVNAGAKFFKLLNGVLIIALLKVNTSCIKPCAVSCISTAVPADHFQETLCNTISIQSLIKRIRAEIFFGAENCLLSFSFVRFLDE